MVEKDFIKEIVDKINELEDLHYEVDSRYSQTFILGKIEALETIAKPQAELYNYNLGILTSCIHKKDKLINELHNEILSLKGELNLK